MGGPIFIDGMIPEPQEQSYEVEELIGIKISLINALEQLDFLIHNMQADLAECDCEDGCCK